MAEVDIKLKVYQIVILRQMLNDAVNCCSDYKPPMCTISECDDLLELLDGMADGECSEDDFVSFILTEREARILQRSAYMGLLAQTMCCLNAFARDDSETQLYERERLEAIRRINAVLDWALNDDDDDDDGGTSVDDNDSCVMEIANEIGELLERKNHDYGNSVHSTYEDYGMTAFLVRIQDKINRLKTLQDSEQQVADEKIEDTLKDIAGYAILALNELRNK